MRFLAKIGPKNDVCAHFCTFCAHFCIILAECNVAQVVGHERQVYDMISDTLEFKNGQKNVQKRPKTSKMTKNGQKTVKNVIFFFFFCLFFSLLCRHFICCSLKRSKIAQNGQKWPKTAKNGIFDRFWVRKKSTPPG